MDRYIGRLLGNRYEILEIIGAGGMAVVYKARCHRLNRLVAIKMLKDENLQDEDFCRRFHAESKAVAMLDHPNIVSVYDVSNTEDEDYIVMELIDGITLKQYMEKKGVLNWKETCHFATHIARALEHAHSRGLVHRDIKPHNVMVLKNGAVKVADFGIARLMEQSNTMTKEALGSVHYISPEQAKGGRVDNRSDLYSLGVVMYEMMTGRPPFDGETPVSVAIKHINGGAPRPSTINPNIPRGLEQIIMKAMAHDMEDRYQDATALLHDLEQFRKNPGIVFSYAEKPFVPQHVSAGAHQPNQANQTKVMRPVRKEREWTTNRQNVPNPDKGVDDTDSGKNKTATVAIIICSIVAMVAIIIFMVLMSQNQILSLSAPNPESFSAATSPTSSSAHQLQHSVTPQIVPSSTAATVQESTSAPPAPVSIQMQNLVDMSQEMAEQVLSKMGLSNVQWVQQESLLPAGTVIGQSVEPGTAVQENQPIIITCAAGAKTVNCTFDMPFRTKPFFLSILLDGRPAVTNQEIQPLQQTASFRLTGKGKQKCEVFVDDRLYTTVTVDFDVYAGD